MSAFSAVQLLRQVLAAAVFPSRCAECGRTCAPGPLCPECMRRTVLHPVCFSGRCRLCGRVLVSETDVCVPCRTDPVFVCVSRVFPLFPYYGWAKDALFSWKIGGQRSLSAGFAQAVYNVWKQEFTGIPVVPVPPRPGKLREKGWDQIADLAGILSRVYKVPVFDVLGRTGAVQQKTLNRSCRLVNLKGAFSVRTGKIRGTEALPGQIVLLDDIATTGATLEACAAALKEKGAGKIYGLVLFSAD